MKDRHLDQMLMCAIYVMAKVTKEDRTFQDIMKCYRQQPQANSEVGASCRFLSLTADLFCSLSVLGVSSSLRLRGYTRHSITSRGTCRLTITERMSWLGNRDTKI